MLDHAPDISETSSSSPPFTMTPFRPDAMSERNWGSLWAIVGMILGMVVAKRLAKDRG
jgi:hypothetical protein